MQWRLLKQSDQNLTRSQPIRLLSPPSSTLPGTETSELEIPKRKFEGRWRDGNVKKGARRRDQWVDGRLNSLTNLYKALPALKMERKWFSNRESFPVFCSLVLKRYDPHGGLLGPPSSLSSPRYSTRWFTSAYSWQIWLLYIIIYF